ncbi:MAG: hypothetical protein ACE5FT_05150 [Candidatus Nanoarchaeia archaeon]
MQAWTILDSWHGWNGYAMHGNTYQLRKYMQKGLVEELERIAKSKSR